MTTPRVVVWFSCGAASAVAAKLAVEKYGPSVRVVYCDTSRDEHPDNKRFFRDVEKWIGVKIEVLKSAKYRGIGHVFMKTKYMAGIEGARCTLELKKIPRFVWQRADDVHIFGFTSDESKRIKGFEERNPDMFLDWVLVGASVDKDECYARIAEAGIELPAMYKLGYHNNNCIGCVKATSPGYWNKIREDFPRIFEARARQSRALGVRLTRVKNERLFLDELPKDARGAFKENLSCGPECGPDPVVDIFEGF